MSMHTTISILDINGAYCKLQMMRTKFEQKLVNDIFSRANLLADHTLGLVPFHILSLHGTLQNKRCPHTKQKKRQPSLDKEMEVGWLQGCFYCWLVLRFFDHFKFVLLFVCLEGWRRFCCRLWWSRRRWLRWPLGFIWAGVCHGRRCVACGGCSVCSVVGCGGGSCSTMFVRGWVGFESALFLSCCGVRARPCPCVLRGLRGWSWSGFCPPGHAQRSVQRPGTTIIRKIASKDPRLGSTKKHFWVFGPFWGAKNPRFLGFW